MALTGETGSAAAGMSVLPFSLSTSGTSPAYSQKNFLARPIWMAMPLKPPSTASRMMCLGSADSGWPEKSLGPCSSP